jgi:undecaprenyl-diphosphatase
MHTLDTLLAKYLIGISFLIACYVFYRLPNTFKKAFLIDAIVGGALTLILAKIGSKLFYDPRPFIVGHITPYFSHANDNGFPSDHTLLASFLGFLVLQYTKKWGYVLLILAAIIGLARVVAKVHHLIDIIGAFASAGIAILIIYCVRSYVLKTVQRNTPPAIR